jgi:hypothetical protein
MDDIVKIIQEWNEGAKIETEPQGIGVHENLQRHCRLSGSALIPHALQSPNRSSALLLLSLYMDFNELDKTKELIIVATSIAEIL